MVDTRFSGGGLWRVLSPGTQYLRGFIKICRHSSGDQYICFTLNFEVSCSQMSVNIYSLIRHQIELLFYHTATNGTSILPYCIKWHFYSTIRHQWHFYSTIWHQMTLLFYHTAPNGTSILPYGTKLHFYSTIRHQMTLIFYHTATNDTYILPYGTKLHFYYMSPNGTSVLSYGTK